MSILGRIFGKAEVRGVTGNVPNEAWRTLGTALRNAAGVTVTPESAMRMAAVYACVRVLAEGVGSLPLDLYERVTLHGRPSKRRATNHPLQALLHRAPNPEMTAIEFREMMTAHTALRGNGYAYIEWGRDGYPVALWPLPPQKVAVSRVQGELVYTVMLNEYVSLTATNVLHLRGITYDGVLGLSPIGLATQAVGLAMAAEEFGAAFYGNGAMPGMVLLYPGKLSDEAHAGIIESWNRRHQGVGNAQKTALLEEGMRLEQVGIQPDHAQFLETRAFQITEIARLFRVPPHMIQDLERATFSNIEHQDLAFVKHTLRPWLTRWEQAIGRDLLLPAEQTKYFAEHNTHDLLRGDTPSRYQAYMTGRQGGWLSANDIRGAENMEPIENGDVYLVPLNMVPASDVLAALDETDGALEQEPRHNGVRLLADPWAEYRMRDAARGVRPEQRDAGGQRQRLMYAQMGVLAEAVARILRREANDIGNKTGLIASAGGAAFEAWVRQFYESHGKVIVEQMRTVMLATAGLAVNAAADEVGGNGGTVSIEAFVLAYLESLAAREVAIRQAAVLDKLDDGGDADEVTTAVRDVLDGWREPAAAEQVAKREAVRLVNAVTVVAYTALGVLRKRWMAFGDSCPYCVALDGKVIGTEEFFLDTGTEFEPEGAARPLRVSRKVGHAPVHAGCDCTIVAEVDR